MEQFFQLFLPLLFSFRFRKGHRLMDSLLRKSAVLQGADHRPRFFADTGHELTVGALHISVQLGRPALDGVQGGMVFLGPQIINGRHIIIGKTEQLQNAVGQKIPFQWLAQDMKPHMDFAVLQLFNVIMETCRIFIEVRSFFIGNVLIQFCLLHQFQNRLFHILHAVSRFLHMGIFIHRLFQFGNFIIGTGIGNRSRHIADEAAGSPPLGNHAFAGNGHMVGIYVRKVSQGNIRIAFLIQPHALARQPFQVPVGTHMNHRIRLPYIPKPIVEGQVLVGRSDVGVMVRL